MRSPSPGTSLNAEAVTPAARQQRNLVKKITMHDGDRREQTRNVREQLQKLTRDLRETIGRAEDQRARALFETTAEVLEGLDRAYQHYEEGSEEAWR